MKVYLFPGNPPAKYFYQQWAKELKSYLPQWEFVVLSYIQEEQTKKPTDLKSVEKKLEGQIKDDQNTPLIFISHSLGSYFAFKLLDRYQKRVKGHLCIFPFIGGASLSAHLQLRALYSIQRNLFLKQGFHSLLKKLPLLLPEVKNITPQEITTAIDLAKNEWELLQRRDLTLVAAYHRQLLIYNPQDRWSPKKTTQHLREYMPSLMTDCSHDFIRFQNEREKMASIIAQYCSSL